MSPANDIVEQIELHSVEGIRKCFAAGLDPNSLHQGKPLLYLLLEMYTRSPRFIACVQAFVEAGLQFPDPALLAVLLDDAASLSRILARDPESGLQTYSVATTFVPLQEASLLHVCAEYNSVACAQVLLDHGIGVDIRAGLDIHGFGGQTPIFHTVNQNQDNSREMRKLLLGRGCDLEITLPGLIWGRGYEWETFIPAVNPISFAMMGLLPQMHRQEAVIAGVVSELIQLRYGIRYKPANIPNAYLKK